MNRRNEDMYFEDSPKQVDEEEWGKIFKKDLEAALLECSKRGLIHSAKWLAELNYTLKDVQEDEMASPCGVDSCEGEKEMYLMCKCYFDMKEYDRCAFFTENCTSPCNRFLHFYSRYLSAEKKRIEDMTELTCFIDPAHAAVLGQLRVDLAKEKTERDMDGYCCYLYGIICKRLKLQREAVDALCEAVRQEPLHWGAWKELVTLIENVSLVKNLDIPHSHWMKNFFLGHLYLENQMNSAAMQVYWTLRERGLQNSRYIQAQLAISYHNCRLVDRSISEFAALQATDPFRLENLDIYSNLLYIKGKKVMLSHLAHRACEIDKYRVETCCIVGNLYSLRSEHQKAAVYFQRALKMNPQYLAAWTLMGHEYMEMKNSSAAIQCYRQAIEACKRDYRAWYGLGQTYEILKMHTYSLYYYEHAQMLQPNDSRMIIAVADMYEKLGRNDNAIRSYKLARSVGDTNGGEALVKLAKLMQKLSNLDAAAVLFKEYVSEYETRDIEDKGELCRAYRLLAVHCLRTQELSEAYHYAQKCLTFEETKEEAKSLLRDIAVMQRKLAMTSDGTPPTGRALFVEADLVWDEPETSNRSALT